MSQEGAEIFCTIMGINHHQNNPKGVSRRQSEQVRRYYSVLSAYLHFCREVVS